jgi:hypothetical protein
MRKLHSRPSRRPARPLPLAALLATATIGCTQASGMPRTPAMTLEVRGARPLHATMSIAECWSGRAGAGRIGRIRAVGATGDQVEFGIRHVRKGTYQTAERIPAVGPLSVVVGGVRYTAAGSPTLTLYDDGAKSGSLTHARFVDAADRPVNLVVEATWRCE